MVMILAITGAYANVKKLFSLDIIMAARKD